MYINQLFKNHTLLSILTFKLGKDISDYFQNVNQPSSSNSFNLNTIGLNHEPEEIQSSSEISDASLSSEITSVSSMATAGASIGLGMLNSSYNDSRNSQLLTSLQSGAIGNHNFFAPTLVDKQISNNNLTTSLQNATMGLGSLFGPEGFVAGIAAAALESIPNMLSTPTMTMNSTSGPVDVDLQGNQTPHTDPTPEEPSPDQSDS